MRSARRFARLSGRERGQLLQALCLLPLTALMVRVLGFRRWQALLASTAPLPTGRRQAAGGRRDEASTPGMGLAGPGSLELARGTARLVEAAARRGLYRANCLQRSLTLWWLLRRQGIAADLRIGTRKAEGRFEAHAWIEIDGVVLNDSSVVQQEFAAFACPLSPANTQAGTMNSVKATR